MNSFHSPRQRFFHGSFVHKRNKDDHLSDESCAVRGAKSEEREPPVYSVELMLVSKQLSKQEVSTPIKTL